jgi:adenosylcobinamide-GDP ribazoletransferase
LLESVQAARLRRVLRSFGCALGFLTRLPVPAHALRDEEVARSAGFFAGVGLLLGALLGSVAWLLAPLGPRLSAAGVLAAWAFLTGALHLDGLADTVDGLSGGRGERARTLEIMRDSRIGAHGATALVLALALKWACLEALFEEGQRTWWLVPVVARFLCTLLLASFSYARESGLGSAFARRVGGLEVALGALVVAPAVVWAGLDFAVGALVGTACGMALALRVNRRLGGLTGDVHGAAIEVAEIGCLLALCWLDLR